MSIDQYRLAGYVLTRPIPRPASFSAELLPQELLSMSGCLAETIPDTWTLAWASITEDDRQSDAAAFGLNPSQVTDLISWATQAFDNSWGWPNVIYSLETARLIHAQFLQDVPGVRLLGLGLHEAHVEAFLRAAS